MMSLWMIFGLLAVLVIAYLVRLNHAMSSVPEEVCKLSPRRWSKEEIRQTYAKMQEKPADFTQHLPPKLERRYVVIGGSGLVGGDLVLHLLARGQSPGGIRIVDFRKPNRDDMLSGPAAQVDFVQADITKPESVTAAFNKPWPPSVAKLPLTVFHTAAVITPAERSRLLYHRSSRVNLDGTKNVLVAAQSVGCDVFIATSSASLAIRPVKFWMAPWRRSQEGAFQVIDESDAYLPLRDHDEYFSNYAVSKAHAERCVMRAGETMGEIFKTGCIRPANGIYGSKFDQTIGTYCNMEFVPTWTPNNVQNFVSAQHVSLAQLCYEAALVSPHWQKVSGKTFVITDPNPPPAFIDLYSVVGTLAVTPFQLQYVPPVLMLLLAYLIEFYNLSIVRFPLLASLGLKEVKGDMGTLQPALFTITKHVAADDSAAQRRVEDGGIGYKGIYTTLELMSDQLRKWNKENEGQPKKQKRRDSTTTKLRDELLSLGSAGAAVKA